MLDIGRQMAAHRINIERCFFFPPALNQTLNSVSLRNGMKRAEIGEFEERNGQRVFVIRGFFQHVLNDVSWRLSKALRLCACHIK